MAGLVWRRPADRRARRRGWRGNHARHCRAYGLHVDSQPRGSAADAAAWLWPVAAPAQRQLGQGQAAPVFRRPRRHGAGPGDRSLDRQHGGTRLQLRRFRLAGHSGGSRRHAGLAAGGGYRPPVLDLHRAHAGPASRIGAGPAAGLEMERSYSACGRGAALDLEAAPD